MTREEELEEIRLAFLRDGIHLFDQLSEITISDLLIKAFGAGVEWQKVNSEHRMAFLKLKDVKSAWIRLKETDGDVPPAVAFHRGMEWASNSLYGLYPVFRVDICFASYAMDYRYIGAKDREDLVLHLKGIFEEDDVVLGHLREIEEEDYRIEAVPDLYTDKPYKILDTFAYYE